MGICKLPGVIDYWAHSTRIVHIGTVMPLERYTKLGCTIHFTDNTNKTTDRFEKIRTLKNHIRLKRQSKSRI